MSAKSVSHGKKSVRIAIALVAHAALGMGCQSQENSAVSTGLSPLASGAAQWLVGTWRQSSDGIDTASAAPPAHHGRMQFQVNPPLFQWEGFRTVGVEGDPTLPGPLNCRVRQISQHFTVKSSADDRSAPGALTVTYFVDDLQLIPDPANNGLCEAYLARKLDQMKVMRESYFFDVYQDSTGQLIDALRHAAFARYAATKTSDGCTAINGIYADTDDAALGGENGYDYVWARSSCNQLTITERSVSSHYDANTGAATLASVTPGTPVTCGQGGDGSCTISGTSPFSLITRSDNAADEIRTKTTETVSITPFGDLELKLVVQDDTGNTLSTSTRLKFLQDDEIPSAQN